ncbi:MAG: WG repeat-containing protein [Bacteroidia bacterium]|nr:WG repeat-containing protein [Bacteroidia bacterium]
MRKIFCPILLLTLLYCSCETPVQQNEVSGDRKPEVFEKDGKYGFRDSLGVIIPARYDFAYDFDTSLVTAVTDSSGWSIIDRKGNYLLTPVVYDNGPDYFEEGLARFIDNGKMGFFNTRGQKVIPANWDFATPFKAGLTSVCLGCSQVPIDEEHWKMEGGKWGMMDKTGKMVIPAEYQALLHFDNDSITIQQDGKWYKMHIRKPERIPIKAPY